MLTAFYGFTYPIIGLTATVNIFFESQVINKLGTLILLLGILGGCSGLERSEQERLRQRNAKAEFIHRNHDDIHYPLPEPVQKKRAAYPWEVQGS